MISVEYVGEDGREVGIQSLEDEDGGIVKVSFDDEFRCVKCGDVFADPDSAKTMRCKLADDGEHELKRTPLAWANRAHIVLDPEEDSITVGVSLTHPAGAFTMKFRRLDDGRLIMHVPFEGMEQPHTPMYPQFPGSFAVG